MRLPSSFALGTLTIIQQLSIVVATVHLDIDQSGGARSYSEAYRIRRDAHQEPVPVTIGRSKKPNAFIREDTVERPRSLTADDDWGFTENSQLTPWPESDIHHPSSSTSIRQPGGPVPPPVAPTAPAELPDDPRHNGLLKDIGSIGVGFNVGVAVPGNDPVSVGARVGIGLGESGLAGGLPIGENIFPRQGEWQSLNDYDGDKSNIVPGKAGKYIQAVREGRILVPRYKPVKSLVGVNGGIGIGR